MRRIVTHKSSDLDAISSVWLIKRFLPNWDGAAVEFVNAGERLEGAYEHEGEAIELVDGTETIHVDTGLGKLDHHQTADNNVCGASLTLDYVLSFDDSTLHKHDTKKEAVERIVQLVVDDDHFQEVYYPESNHDIYELGLVAIIKGYKLMYQKDDAKLVEFVMECLDSILHNLETKIWAEREIKEKGEEFNSEFGKSLAIESMNDEVLKLAQMMGFVLVIRKDPELGFVRIKTLPDKRGEKSLGIDLTGVYEKLKEMDPEAHWFLHASKRMLLNGSSKNPEMKGTTLTLAEVKGVLEK